jgi:NAD(P)H-hydrate epimerase
MAPSRTRTFRDAVYVLTREQSRRLDRLAETRLNMPSLLLMENAGINAAAATLQLLEEHPGPILVFCGPGNNGGDGMVMARHLANAGCLVGIALAGEPRRLRGDAAVQHRIVAAMGIPMARVGPRRGVSTLVRRLGRRPGLVVDALLGTGASGELREPITSAVGMINDLGSGGATVLAVDIPTGLDADTGVAPGSAVRADVTVTFAALKPCFLHPSAEPFAGRVLVAGIGVPDTLIARVAGPVRGRLTRGGRG